MDPEVFKPATEVLGTPPKSIKIVCFSDTHSRYGQKVLKKPHQGDLLLHAGDFSFEGAYTELSRFDDWLEEQDFDQKIIIPGNHDKTFETDWENACRRVPAADAILNQWTHEAFGLKIYGEPRQPWFYDWAFNVDRPLMKDVWSLAPSDTDILVTHGPPFGAGDLTRDGRRVGCVHQREWIEKHQPRLVVCGHIHQGYGIYVIGRTIVVNASICNERYSPSNEPIKIELSLD